MSMTNQSFADILKNPHFNNLAAICRVAANYRSRWLDQHPESKFRFYERAAQALVFSETPPVRAALLNAWLLLFSDLAANGLSYTPEDLDWLVQVFDSGQAQVVLAIFCAWYTAPDTYLTPQEVADLTATSESNWRNKAAGGDIPGAYKAGKQWLLPASVLRAQGVLREIPRVDDTQHDDD